MLTVLPPPSAFAKALADVAVGQFDSFHLIDESHEPLFSQIKKYWDAVGVPFPGVVEPWSAVFISFCVKQAGATAAEFQFSPQHSVFVNRAINDPGAFRGFDLPDESARVGDIIQNNRLGTHHDFAFAASHSDYPSHTAIVVARGEDHLGKFALTVGGNESNSIRRVRIQLNDDGSVRQRTNSPFICLLKNQK